jgi:hypothetical protein
VDAVRTSQATHLRASTVCYGDSFTSLFHFGFTQLQRAKTLKLNVLEVSTYNKNLEDFTSHHF